MGIRGLVRRGLEKTFGVAILRRPPTKHFYRDLARLRTWSKDDVIFDVGANDGRTVEALHEALPAPPRIFSFEPVSSTFRVLAGRTARYANVAAFPFALGAEPARAEMHLHELSVMNSLVASSNAAVGSEEVEVRTVDGMMRELGIDFVHFLKIDTEGYELEVLKGARGALEEGRIGIVQAEFHRTPAEGLERLERFLLPFGYDLYGLYNQTHERVESTRRPHVAQAGYRPLRLAYADAVFLHTGRKGG